MRFRQGWKKWPAAAVHPRPLAVVAQAAVGAGITARGETRSRRNESGHLAMEVTEVLSMDVKEAIIQRKIIIIIIALEEALMII